MKELLVSGISRNSTTAEACFWIAARLCCVPKHEFHNHLTNIRVPNQASKSMNCVQSQPIISQRNKYVGTFSVLALMFPTIPFQFHIPVPRAFFSEAWIPSDFMHHAQDCSKEFPVSGCSIRYQQTLLNVIGSHNFDGSFMFFKSIFSFL